MGGIDGVKSELAHVAVENGKKETNVNGHVGEIDFCESVHVEKSPDTSFITDYIARSTPVKISPWTLARLDAEEVSEAAAEGRKRSKILQPVSRK
ncbi:putative protein S-acyltransferase 22 [Artemisia annua]|uniref:Uncharacterized protein n=1 Tax=Artemisia annua TaxID=35608 RepID=A0A2U1KLS7_ARTAN|nr:putative protein S-acyltransferase 22 [Artemisia annua]